MTRSLEPLSFPLRGSRLIEASAGTGKTWTIASLYLRLVLGHGGEAAFARTLAPHEILVMTFTRAATRELSDRIRSRLVDAARGFRDAARIANDDALLRELLAAYPDEAARETAAWRLSTAAEAMDDAAIFTIDAWVQRMLREHAFDSGSLFDEELQPDDEAMLVEATRDYWRQQVYPLGRDAVDDITTVWRDVDALLADVRLLMRYIDASSENDESLGMVWRRGRDARRAVLESVRDGWAERIEAIRTWVREQLASPGHPFVGTRFQTGRTDGWLDELLRWLSAPDGTPFPWKAAIHRLSREGLHESLKPGRTVDVPSLFDDLQARIATVLALPDTTEALRRHAAAGVGARLRSLKHRAGAFGFDDLLARLDEALAGPNGERLRGRIVAQYPVAMIDEFQDTSPRQYRIFDRLYRIADDDAATALLLIGDPKQSIYGFRGADIQSYLQARTATADRHYLLTTNWRATAGLVAAIDHLFGQAEARDGSAFRFAREDETSEWPLPFHPVDARGRSEALFDARGPIAALTIAHDDELAARRDVQRRFAERCAEHIATSLVDERAGFVDATGGFARLKPADITVLVRDRSEAASVRASLQRRRIASAFLSDQDSVFATDEARDLLHWLRAVANPMDARRARVAFATTLVDLPLAALAASGHDDVAFEARLDALKTLNAEWRRQGVLPMLRRSLHLLDLPARWLARADGERKLTNVLHLAELLQAASLHLDGEQALIRWLADQIGLGGRRADEQILRLESDAELVRVVTIHSAKGLEYPIVYVPFACSYRRKKWNDGDVAVLPDGEGGHRLVFDVDDDDRAAADLEQRQEEMRLLYVALTRARHALWLGVAPLKDGNGDRCAFHRSAFGWLIGGDTPLGESDIAARLHRVFDGQRDVRLVAVDGETGRTTYRPAAAPPLIDRPAYAAGFERDWSIGSFSAFVRDLSRVPAVAAIVAPAVEEELLSGPDEEAEADTEPAVPSDAPRHRFPRGALAGNFLHDQLEWLAAHRFALATDPSLRDQLARRCERQGWGSRAHDVVSWMSEIVTTTLPPIGRALDALPRIVPEMEFWFPSEGVDARRMDRLCREHLLDGRERPALPDRTLRGMLMGFADLVFEVDGRYWVLDYKSNALGRDDDDYTADALAASMAHHRYDVQSAIYLLALHRLLRQRLGAGYDPARRLGGALYLFVRGIGGPRAGCHVVEPPLALLDALDAALGSREGMPS